MQGDFYVTDTPQEVLTTILGSCIAACIRDPSVGVGGMNHFLLPEGDGEDRNARRFGVNAMEILINDILKRGGERSRLEAKLFGGANVINAMSDVGSRNAAFAKQFLSDEGISIRVAMSAEQCRAAYNSGRSRAARANSLSGSIGRSFWNASARNRIAAAYPMTTWSYFDGHATPKGI